jgi:O-succinylhomoserine sulfhydrylase
LATPIGVGTPRRFTSRTDPATTTHQRLKPEQRAQLGITDGMVRLSCGLEHHDDLIDDVVAALRTV